jgi:hypothetical protein
MLLPCSSRKASPSGSLMTFKVAFVSNLKSITFQWRRQIIICYRNILVGSFRILGLRGERPVTINGNDGSDSDERRCARAGENMVRANNPAASAFIATSPSGILVHSQTSDLDLLSRSLVGPRLDSSSAPGLAQPIIPKRGVDFNYKSVANAPRITERIDEMGLYRLLLAYTVLFSHLHRAHLAFPNVKARLAPQSP